MSESILNRERTPFFGALPEKWGWLVGLGVISTLLGAIGLGMTFGLTVAGVVVFGALLVTGGGFQLFDAFKYSGWRSTFLHAAIALVYVVTGFMMVLDPQGAAVALTLLLGVALVLAGTLRIMICVQHKGNAGWKVGIAGGVVSLLLGLLVMIGWPFSGYWFIGLVIAVELLINGWTAIFLGLVARRFKQDHEMQL